NTIPSSPGMFRNGVDNGCSGARRGDLSGSQISQARMIPRSFPIRLIHRNPERYALLLHIDLKDLDFDFLPLGQPLADHAIDRTGNPTDMQEAVDAPQIDEGAIVDDIANSPPNSVPSTQRSQEPTSPLVPLVNIVEAIPARRKIAPITSLTRTKPARGRDR